ncbi:MAG: cysteine synthase family protein [Myxococcales bacterium]|nr:cysteine synthase family protein [Myxococcales bacterium]
MSEPASLLYPDDPFEGAQGLLASVGNTPLVRIQGAIRGLVPDGVEIWGKCEWFNPGGSVKDRAALAMVLDAERRGVLTPGRTILDASSGNTGISYALIAAARGYRLKLCLPTNANEERKLILGAYGAELVLTDPLEGSDGAIRKARELAAADPDLVYLDQYGNDANWRAHHGSTGPEIWRQTDGRVTHFVSALGTSGTFMGTSRFLKEVAPHVQVHALQPDSPFHGLEGLKHMESAIVPRIYDEALADVHLEAPTEAAYVMARRLATEDGLLVGPSAAAAVWGCVQVAQGLTEGVIVTILCDSGTRYLSEDHIWRT